MTVFPKTITREQAAGTGMAAAFILLLLGLSTGQTVYYKSATGVLLLNMIWPMAFYPLGILWFGLANVMGAIMSRVILAVLFVVMVIPVGVFRRKTAADPMMLKQWKKGTASVFKIRNDVVSKEDIEHPY